MFLTKSEKEILETTILNLIFNVFDNLDCNKVHTRHIICDFAKDYTKIPEEEIDMFSLGYIKLPNTYLNSKIFYKMRDLSGCIYYKIF